MSSYLLSSPEIEPVSLAEARDYLRIGHDEDDDTISSLISGARIHVEAQTRRALITQTWRLVRDCWPSAGLLPVLPAPVRALVAVRIIGADGEAQAADTGAFVLDTASAPAVLSVRDGARPRPGRAVAGIEIDIEAGYGDAVSDVPQPLRHAIRLLTAHWYENRALVSASGEVSAMPASVSALLAPFRVLSL